MLRRAHLVGLLLAAVAVPALAADFIVNGNVNVAGLEGAPGNLTVSGVILVPNNPTQGTPLCNSDHFGEIGTALYPYWSSGEQDAMLYFCGVKHVGGQDLAQRYFLNVTYWPEDTARGRGGRAQHRPDSAALAARVATLEKQLAALKAVACRDHASEAACR